MSYDGRRQPSGPPGATNGTPNTDLLQPGLDQVFDTLGCRYRRSILLLLKHGAVETKTDVLGRKEFGEEIDEVTLVHSLLPKLEDAGYIEWDRETEAISRGPCFDEVESLLDLIESNADELPSN